MGVSSEIPQQTMAHEENAWSLGRTIVDAVIQVQIPGVAFLIVALIAALAIWAKKKGN